MMRVEEVTHRSELAARQDEWRELVSRAPAGDIFQSYEWLGPWLDCFWAQGPIRFLFVRQGERLVGLAPLLLDTDGQLGCPNSWTMPANAHVRRLDFLHAADARAVVDAILAHLHRVDPRRRLVLHRELADSPIASALRQAATPCSMGWASKDTARSPAVRIDSDWETYLASRGSHLRDELRRKVRKLERDRDSRWSVVSDPGECQRAMDEVMVIEERSWKEDTGTSLTVEAGMARFYRDLAGQLANAGWLRLYLLHLGGRPVAYLLGAEFKRQFFAIKTSYDAEFRKASPGIVLFQYALQDAFRRELTGFEFLGEQSRWKNELANEFRPHARLCLFRRLDARCQWCAVRDTVVKPFVRERAPWLSPLARKVTAAILPSGTQPPPRR